MIRVCMTVGTLGQNNGGPSRSIPQVCEHLAEQGIDINLGYSKAVDSDALWVPTRDAKVKRQIYPSICFPGMKKIAFYPGLAGMLTEFCLDNDTQIVHDNGVWTGSNRAAAKAAQRCKIPMVLSPRGMLTRWAVGHNPIRKRAAWLFYQRRICQQAQMLHATGRAEAADLRALGLSNPIAIIANGVDIPRFKMPPPRPKGGGRRLLFLSRIHPKKGLIALMRAVSALRRVLVEGRWIVTIAGPDEGGHLLEVKNEAVRLGLEKIVEFHDFVDGDEKWALYRSSDLFVLPTFSENFGIVIAEALGCGIPVVTTQGTPWNELLTHRCGWWHPVGQEALESSLRQALTTPVSRLREMGLRGRKLVRDNYEWPEIARRLKKTYEWVLHSRVGEKSPKPDFIYEVTDRI